MLTVFLLLRRYYNGLDLWTEWNGTQVVSWKPFGSSQKHIFKG